MSLNLDTPIISIYDLMVERRRNLTYDPQSRDISKGAQKVPRGKVEEELNKSNIKIKKLHLRATKALREMSSSQTLALDSYRPSKTITASQLTKKQSFMMIHPPANKEVIRKLVEKMSMGCSKSENVDPDPLQEQPKQRKGKGTKQGHKQKPKSSNSDLPSRALVSPRKPYRGPQEMKVDSIPKKKTKLKANPKIKTPMFGRFKNRVRESARSNQTVPLSTGR